MFPTLLKIGDFPIHSYGFFIAVGFLLCVWVSKREAVRLGLPGERIVDIGFWSLLVGMIGCRLLYVLTLWPEYAQNPLAIFYVWEGGLVFWAGPLANIPFFIWYCRKYKLPAWKVIDIGAQAIPLAHAFGRIGCLSVGCCHGKPTGGDWGIRLNTELVDPVLRNVPLHPVQLYESVALLVLFFALRRMRLKAHFDGQITCVYLIAYSIIRSILEVFRGDNIRGFVIGDWLSTSQFISILVVSATLVLYFALKKRAGVSGPIEGQAHAPVQ